MGLPAEAFRRNAARGCNYLVLPFSQSLTGCSRALSGWLALPATPMPDKQPYQPLAGCHFGVH